MRESRHEETIRKKVSRVMDELHNALFQAGATRVNTVVERREDAYCLILEADYDPACRHDVERMERLLQPEERNPALVEAYWELAGGDGHSGDSELSLVGHMVDHARTAVENERVRLELEIRR